MKTPARVDGAVMSFSAPRFHHSASGLKAVAERVDIIEDSDEGNNGAVCAQLLAEIDFSQALIIVYSQEELMWESVVYQSVAADFRFRLAGQ